tara:strand:+ start:489 stop:734 length:246 start_codon:yes stop_codon:yes gene_type:complete
MQPKHLHAHARVKHEPTIKVKQRVCRLYGKDFNNIAEAARYWGISYSWAIEQVNAGRNKESFPEKNIHKGNNRGKWRENHA